MKIITKKIYRVFISVSFLLIGLNVGANPDNEGENSKKHNFGIGFSGSTFPVVQNYSNASNCFNTGLFDMTSAFVSNISLKYDYNYSKHFSFSFEPGFINQYLVFKNTIDQQVDASINTDRLYMNFNQITIPLLVNFHSRIIDNINFIGSLGVGGLFNLKKEQKFDADQILLHLNNIDYYSIYKNKSLCVKNQFDYEFILRGGIEILTKRKMQFTLSYRFSPNKNYYLNSSIEQNNIRVSNLELGFGIFL